MSRSPHDSADAGNSPLARQFALEKEFARKLMSASRDERRGLYTSVYDELFRQFPHLVGPSDRPDEIALKMLVLRPLLRPGDRFLEVGAGEGSLAAAVAEEGLSAIAIDASTAILSRQNAHPRLEVRVSDGPPYEIPDASVQLAFSCHFVEHIHPEDLREHLAEMMRVLAPGGAYVCVTPNRLLGPHDVSRYFTTEACGLHLREYTYGTLAGELRRAGFRDLRVLAGLTGRRFRVPVAPVAFAETLLGILPRRLRSWILSRRFLGGSPEPLRLLEQVKLVGWRAA
ncbi:MAG: class I SAM-dependent methyltransferase [Thermoanaerobaculia bacterium]